MIIRMHEGAEDDLTGAFVYYEAVRTGLGRELLSEFRRGVERILTYPRGWQRMDDRRRRYRLHRFPFGIIYEVDEHAATVTVLAVMHLHRDPEAWRERRGLER